MYAYVCICMYMYVCVCMYVCMYVYVCMCMYVCMYVYVCMCMYVWMYVCMYRSMNKNICSATYPSSDDPSRIHFPIYDVFPLGIAFAVWIYSWMKCLIQV